MYFPLSLSLSLSLSFATAGYDRRLSPQLSVDGNECYDTSIEAIELQGQTEFNCTVLPEVGEHHMSRNDTLTQQHVFTRWASKL